VDHHKGRRYLLGLVYGTYRFEEISVAFQRAILGLAQGPPVATSVLEKGDHVGDPDYVHPGRPQLGILGERGEHHEASVRAAHHGYSLVPPPAQPVDRMGQILYRIHPEVHVVEVGVGLAVARRAPHVRGEDGVAPSERYWVTGAKSGRDCDSGPP
jgi:hypothetical protein